jgi:hypothetical protein
MTKKRWIVLAGMLEACVFLTLVVPALLPPRPGVTRANFERIEDGMTPEEVEMILGGPRDSILGFPRPEEWIGPSPEGLAAKKDPYVIRWYHPRSNAIAVVKFDDHDGVIGKSWNPGYSKTFFQQLFSFFRL